MRGVYFSALLLLAATSAAETFNDNDIIPLVNIYLARHEDADSTGEDYASGSPLDQADGLHYDGAHYDDIWITEDEDACPRHQAGKMCDIMISGVDQVADKSAQIDGKYVFDGCHQGRPKYRRQGRDVRWLWFSKPYRDWEIGASEASENSILMYGGLGSGELRPEHVHHTLWHLRTTLSSKPWVEGGRGFVRITVRIECVSNSTAAWQRLKAAAWQRLRG